MNSNKKICIISYKLGLGGFYSSLKPLIKNLVDNNISVDVMLFEKSNEDSFIANKVKIFYVDDEMKSIYKWANLLKSPLFISIYLKKILLKSKLEGEIEFSQCESYLNSLQYKKVDFTCYDCVIGWEEGIVLYYLSNMVKAKKKIGVIHPDYKKAKFSKKIDNIGLKELDNILTVSKATCNVLKNELPNFSKKIDYIYNTLCVDEILNLAKEDNKDMIKSSFDIVSVMRLDNKSKALDRLVNIANRLNKEEHEFKWYIIGDGADKYMLQKLITENNLQEKIILTGGKENPHSYTKKADLFVLQSYYEGRSVSVEEAKVIKTPVLISEYSSAKEQIIDGVTGFIADNNEKDIYDKLKFILENKENLEIIRNNLKNIELSEYTDISKLMEIIYKKGEN